MEDVDAWVEMCGEKESEESGGDREESCGYEGRGLGREVYGPRHVQKQVGRKVHW